MAQYGRPISDISNDGWNISSGSTIWAVLDEVTPNDTTDYINSGNNPTNLTFEVKLSPATDPTSSTGHIFKIRLSASKTNGTTDCYLYQGTSLISTMTTISHTTSYTTYSKTLSEAEANAITSYSDLRIRATSSATASTNVNITWAELEVPDFTQHNIVTNIIANA